ncbi:filamin-binding LIM protein 1 isoform X1 [Cygnus atratus]|uniref:filamin-binding LIM protein 1 isoform X1 n=1 Tax=Cygnus atratus TaxID=8868 RepID=UPI0015D5DFC4|nr:filamin-binding LIM protein 1 isoform X1 [Cygnus atratus]
MGTRPFIAVTWDGHGAARSFSLSGKARRRRVEAEGQRGCRHTKLQAHRQISLCCLYYFLCLVFEKKKSSTAPAHLPFPRCSPGKRRRGWLHPCSSPWCPRGGRQPPRNGPNRGCHPPSLRAPIAPGHPCHSLWLCPTEVRGVRGVPRARTMPVPRIPRRCFAKGCGCRRGGGGGGECAFGEGCLWGGCSPNPQTNPGLDPAAGEGLCLLSIAGHLSALFVSSCRAGVCFWGWSVSTAAKRRGVIAGGEVWDGSWRRPPNVLCLAFPAESCPRSPPAPVPSSSPVLILSEVPQPLSAEALGPALQQLDLAAPATLQAPSAFPAELRPPKFCQEQADKPPWQDANGHLERDGSRDICAFCHKAVGPREPTVEAMRKQYHADCFTCRTCHQRLAGQRYYQRDGRPTCDACYQATLEKCAKCQGLISEHIVRAMGKGFHPSCFACTACGQAIGTESFAVDERDEVYCVADFYRKYAPVCGACKLPIIPSEDQDTYKIECLGRSFHESCYRCESCGTPLSPEPTEDGCYPLGQHLLCKSCHVRRRNESSC